MALLKNLTLKLIPSPPHMKFIRYYPKSCFVHSRFNKIFDHSSRDIICGIDLVHHSHKSNIDVNNVNKKQ